MRRIILVAALATAFAAPGEAHAQSFLKRLKNQVGNQVINSIASGQLPKFASSEGGPSAGGFENYGPWDFKLDRLELGADDSWQAVIAVRNASPSRLGMVASEIKLFLLTEDGETLSSWGELYKASEEGSAQGLVPVNGTLWLEPGDMTKVRLRFDGSRGLKPAKLRIQSTGASSQSRMFPVAG